MLEPIDYHKLNEVFSKFANKEAQDKVVAELQKAIEDMGLSARVLVNDELPKTFEWMPRRINVRVNNYTNDGKFHIKRDFRIG